MTFNLRSILYVAVLLLFSNALTARADFDVDTIRFGNGESEKVHRLDGDRSEIISGALGGPARQLLPRKGEHWQGSRIKFRMRVDPDQANYFTAKFWGGDLVEEANRLMLFIEGKQVGQRHLGEVGPLDIMGDAKRYPGRFFYKTLPLPLNMTQGKTSVELAIEVQGHIWGYGNTFERYQRALEKPSRGIYSGYTHTDSFFMPDSSEVQGSPPSPALRDAPGEELISEVKHQVNNHLRKLLGDKGSLAPDNLLVLAHACLEPWTNVYHNKKALEKIASQIDLKYLEYQNDKTIHERTWEGAGKTAEAVRLLAGPLRFYVDKPVQGTKLVRRSAWTEMFKASRNWHVQHRRSLANQSMFVDLNIYRCNRAIHFLDSKQAWPDEKAISLLHEAIGVENWRGNWDDHGNPTFSHGRRFTMLTEGGLTKELGYVGGYGEIVHDAVRQMYDATRPQPDSPGDEKIKQQLIKIARARACFRYPHMDKDGFKSMRLEAVVGWRDSKYPGQTIYDQVASQSGGPLDTAYATGDPQLIGWGQQMLADGQFFAAWDHVRKLRRAETLITLTRLPRLYEWIIKQPASEARLPMTPGQPDLVFADPEAGVVAIKHKDAILYVSLYWRARYAINNLARVHYMTPSIQWDATVFTEAKFTKSKQFHTIPDQTNMGFSRKFEGDYKDAGMHLATAGLTQPIAKVPAHFKDFRPGKENIHAGKADLYVLTYGPYYIAMNAHVSKKISAAIPKTFIGARNLGTGATTSDLKVSLKPGQCLVLYRDGVLTPF